MATNGTPFEGRDNIIATAVYTGLDLRLYTNTANSLTVSTILANLTFPSGTGYATFTLSGTWSSTNGVVTYDDGTPDNPEFENTGVSNWTGDPTGAVITDGTFILHFKDFALGTIVMTPGKVIEVDISTLTS